MHQAADKSTLGSGQYRNIFDLGHKKIYEKFTCQFTAIHVQEKIDRQSPSIFKLGFGTCPSKPISLNPVSQYSMQALFWHENARNRLNAIHGFHQTTNVALSVNDHDVWLHLSLIMSLPVGN